MDVKQALIIILSGTLGTIGFSLFFKINPKRIFFTTIGGALTCVCYVLCLNFFSHEFFQNLFPALLATSYSEIAARVTKSPSTPYIACSIISLVPGGKLYYTMYNFIISDMPAFRTTLVETMRIAAGLAVGIIIVSVIVREINYRKFEHLYDY